MTSPWLLVNELTSRKKWRAGSHGQGDGEGAGGVVGQHIHGVAAPCLEGRKDGASSGASRSRAAEREAQARRPPNQQDQKTPRPRHPKRGLAGAVGESAPEEPQAASPLTKRGGTAADPDAGSRRRPAPGPVRRNEEGPGESRGPRRDPAKPGADQSRSPRGAPVQENPRGLKSGENLIEIEKSGTGARGARSRPRRPDAAGNENRKTRMNRGYQKTLKKKSKCGRPSGFSHSHDEAREPGWGMMAPVIGCFQGSSGIPRSFISAIHFGQVTYSDSAMLLERCPQRPRSQRRPK